MRSEIEETRLRVLKELFQDVSPQPRKKAPTVFSKRPLLWSADELETMVQLLVQITLDVQQKGRSDVVEKVATTLGALDSFVPLLSDRMADKLLTVSLSLSLSLGAQVARSSRT